MMTINTLYELVRNSVEKFASKVAFSMYEGDDVTYAEVDRRIARVQEILTGAGLRAGDKVALLSSNMPNWGISYFAVTSAGMVAVPILPDFSGEELDMIIEHSEAKALLVSDKLFTKLSKQTIERLNVAVRTKNLGVISQRVRGEGSTGVPRPDDLAVIIYTSGTTSKPKGVMLTHAALCAQILQVGAEAHDGSSRWLGRESERRNPTQCGARTRHPAFGVFPAGDLHTTVAARREPPTWGFILRNLQAPCGCKPQVDKPRDKHVPLDSPCSNPSLAATDHLQTALR